MNEVDFIPQTQIQLKKKEIMKPLSNYQSTL